MGSGHFIEEDEGIDCSPAHVHADNLRKEGKNLLFVARDGVLEGVIALRDVLRPEAPRALNELKKLGVSRLIMLTGDHPDSAKAAASRLEALDEVYWDLKPEDKANLVREFKEQGCVVAFAGDGVNDAPALVTADVGICMPGGAELAREAAQVVLLHDNLTTLAEARRIAARIQNTLKNSFAAAVGLNSIFLLLAAQGFLTPTAAALLHNANTIGILGYSAMSGLSRPNTEDDPLEEIAPCTSR